MSSIKIIYTNEASDCEVIQTSHRRIQIVFFSMFIVLLTLILRIFDLSIFNYSDLQSIAQGENEVNIRNNIVDRNGIILASTLPTASAYIYPKHFTNSIQSLKSISKVININIDALEERLIKNKHFIWLKRHLTPLEQQTLHNLGIPGIHFVNDQKRIYPHKNLFSHLVGLVDIDNNGISGLESSFNEDLKDPTKTDIQTSLDTRIQYIVKQELNNVIKLHDAIGGTAIVMDVNTGELISSVSLPDFNPYDAKEIANKKLFNQATLGVYEMGSVLKALTLAIGIDSGEINLSDSFDVSTPIKIDTYKIKDYRGGKGGVLSIPEILMYSSNIGVAHIIKEVGISKQKEYFKKLGLLTKINIEVPEKSNPIFPTDRRWKELRSITMSYGHGISMTPVHLIQTFSAIVNNGILRKATIIKDKNNENSGKQIFKPQTSSLMNKILRLTATSGFARRANVDQYLVGAKTGTAEKIINGKYSKKLNIALCAAAFPMNDPKYAIIILVDEPKQNNINHGFATGGMVAAPVVSSIVSKIAPILDLAPIDHNNPKISKALYVDYKPMYKRFAKR
ncbi:MAG: peptidoglycan D,D-transpeptidase FtsI family protein [Candidatus Midichloriaceae bacterium]